MSEKKQLNEEQLSKANGGVDVGDHRIIECLVCGSQFDPDITSKGPYVVIPNENGNGYSSYSTWFCPKCEEFQRYKVIQVKKEDLIDSSIFSI